MLFVLTAGILLNTALALGALLKKAVTPFGSALGFAIGLTLFLGGSWVLWTALCFFFLSSTIIGRLEKKYRPELDRIIHKNGSRDWLQVSANGMPAVLFIIIFIFTAELYWLTASYAALAAATADTWASEIGVLSSKKPVSILTMKHVEPGMSGGITLMGSSAAAVGALFTALVSLLCPRMSLLSVLIIFISGNIGTVIDSMLGAGVQAKYIDSREGYFTEHAENNIKTGGVSWMTNDMVNLIATTLSGGAAVLLSLVMI